jgi:hypothetical protein
MVGNRFTVILNYNGKRRPEMKSLLILSEGKSVEIFPDFSVSLLKISTYTVKPVLKGHL